MSHIPTYYTSTSKLEVTNQSHLCVCGVVWCMHYFHFRRLVEMDQILDQLKPYVQEYLEPALAQIQTYLDQVIPTLQLYDDIQKATASWDYVTITLIVTLLIAALPSFMWLGVHSFRSC